MTNSKIAINGFFGRMGQAIYELSLEQKFNVTLGVDKKEKLQSDLNLKLSDNLSKRYFILLSSINVPVGLLGLAKKTIFVLLLHFLSILSTSANLLVSFALIGIAPLNDAEILYIAKPCSV